MLLASAFTLSAQSQTKGTNAIGLGIGTITTKQESTNSGSTWNSKGNGTSVNVNYGYFLKDNIRLGLVAAYSNSKSTSQFNGIESKSNTDGWAGGISLGRYYPVVRKLYATVNGGPIYNYSKSEQSRINNYALSAWGGLSYFVNKRFLFETTLVSADASYTSQKVNDNSSGSQGTTKTKSFGASTSGQITNLNFRINFLF